MFEKAKAGIFRKAAENREQPTASEALLWARLNKRQLGMRFKRQHPIDRFIVDFYCHPVKLVIELDGGYHQDVEQQNYDDQRTFCLEELGCTVIRFENNQVANDIEGVIQEIEAAMALAPSGNQRARGGEVMPDELSNGTLSVFPNPAKDHVTIDYRIDRTFEKALLRIIDQKGVVLKEIALMAERNQILMPLDLIPSSYRCELLVDGASYRSAQLVIK